MDKGRIYLDAVMSTQIGKHRHTAHLSQIYDITRVYVGHLSPFLGRRIPEESISAAFCGGGSDRGRKS